MKCKSILVGFFLGLSGSQFAQFSDSFSNGNLKGWQGDTINFLVNPAKELQLNAPAGSSSSFIYVPIAFADSMVWQYRFRLDFAPSSGNQLIVYLALIHSDPSTSPGYFLEIGAPGDMDAIIFKYFDGNISEVIGQSAAALVATEPVELNLHIIAKNGYWKFYKHLPGHDELLFTAYHEQPLLSQLNIFGIQCRYSDSRRDKFYFDDFLIEPFAPDTLPPDIISMRVENDRSVTLEMNEPPEVPNASLLSNYLLQPVALQPSSVSPDKNFITISWDYPFISMSPYSLYVSMLKDTSGNIMTERVLPFSYIHIEKAVPDEILITEVMADPAPTVGLPETEYIELYNNSGKVFDLSEYKVKIGSSERALRDSILFPGEYMLLTGDDQAGSFPFIRTMGIANMPALPNSGTTIEIRGDDDRLIHQVTYTTDWYRVDQKNNGGWSLEMINPMLLCADEDNWSASVDLKGGTPGKENSQWDTRPDTTGPTLLSIFPASANMIELHFNEKIEPHLMLEPGRFSFSPELSLSDLQLTDQKTLKIYFSQEIKEGITYKLLPFEAIDCLGNPVRSSDTIIFGKVSAPAPGDLLLNEILFNPVSGGSRFIEVINAGDKFINLGDVSVGRVSDNSVELYPLELREILSAGEIAAITEDRADILSRYTVPNPEKLFESDLPSWDDETDNVSLVYEGIVIDSLTYFSDWHHPVIADQEGVSLERVSIFFSGTGANMWHSSASLYGFATPTGPNSQTAILAGYQAPFRLTNRNFSPNDDGFKDFLLVDFEPGHGNSVGSMWVYDLEGREIRQLLSNETLGDFTVIQWDGRNSDGKIADMGIYVLLAQLWDETGRISQYQETCSLIKR